MNSFSESSYLCREEVELFHMQPFLPPALLKSPLPQLTFFSFELRQEISKSVPFEALVTGNV
jgi:hypothetical protein